MNDKIISIIFKDGTSEIIYCCEHRIADGVLNIYIRYQETRCFPLDTIKEFRIER